MAKFATNASGVILWPNSQLMQVAPAGGQICKWCHMVAKFAINASGAMLLPNLIQVTQSISGSVVPLAMFLHWASPKKLKYGKPRLGESPLT